MQPQRPGAEAGKILTWIFLFLVFVGYKAGPVVLLEYMVFFLFIVFAVFICAKSVQQWFAHGEALAKRHHMPGVPQ